MYRKPKILFISTDGPTAAQMAQAIMHHYYRDEVEVFSASSGATNDANSPMRAALAEENIAIADGHHIDIDNLSSPPFDCTILLDEPTAPGADHLYAGSDATPDKLSPPALNNAIFSGIPAVLHWHVTPLTPADSRADERLSKTKVELKTQIDALMKTGFLKALMIQRLQTERLFDLLEDGVVVHDENRRIYLVNRAVELVTGRTREAILGHDCHTVFAPGGLCGSHCAFKSAETTANTPREIKTTFLNANGETRHIRVKSEPILMDSQYRGVMAIVRDTTELNELRWRMDHRRTFHGMTGVSPKIVSIFETIRAVATSDYPVLITGESGTGKELAANAIHKESRRTKGPFVPVNCGALPENILESELFGHVRGAFTGAIRDKKGRFELADGGTLFLDEVGELPLHVQVKLLRVLQEKTFERVGGEKPIKADVRIVAATNQNLRQMVIDGAFREDLFYRLCVVPLELPPLRERTEDIPYLVEQILKNIQQESGKSITGVDDSAMSLLFRHGWPGNIRELINALQFSSIHSHGERIEAEHLPHEIRFQSALVQPASTDTNALTTFQRGLPVQSTGSTLPPMANGPRRAKLTVETVLQALAETGGNKVKAARILGVGRATLYRFFADNQMDV